MLCACVTLPAHKNTFPDLSACYRGLVRDQQPLCIENEDLSGKISDYLLQDSLIRSTSRQESL